MPGRSHLRALCVFAQIPNRAWSESRVIDTGLISAQSAPKYQHLVPPRPLVSAVSQPSPSLQKHSGAEKAVAVPPMTRAPRRAAEAEDTFVVAIKLAAFLMRLKPLPFGCRSLGFEPRLDRRILRKEMREIGDKILDNLMFASG